MATLAHTLRRVRPRSMQRGAVAHDTMALARVGRWLTQLKRFVVMDPASGAVFYDEMWEWPEAAHPELLLNLAAACFQFAREMSDGGAAAR